MIISILCLNILLFVLKKYIGHENFKFAYIVICLLSPLYILIPQNQQLVISQVSVFDKLFFVTGWMSFGFVELFRIIKQKESLLEILPLHFISSLVLPSLYMKTLIILTVGLFIGIKVYRGIVSVNKKMISVYLLLSVFYLDFSVLRIELFYALCFLITLWPFINKMHKSEIIIFPLLYSIVTSGYETIILDILFVFIIFFLSLRFYFCEISDSLIQHTRGLLKINNIYTFFKIVQTKETLFTLKQNQQLVKTEKTYLGEKFLVYENDTLYGVICLLVLLLIGVISV